jgi:hypothetical protein
MDAISGIPSGVGPYRYYKGPKGIGIYTVNATNGNYRVFYAKPTGPGARQGKAKDFEVVPRLSTTRASKSRAIDRAYALAYGEQRREKQPARKIARDEPHIGYCMKEKKRVRVDGWQPFTAKNGRGMLKSHCPDCGTQIQKYGRLGHCGECGELQEMAADDYICKFCRQKEHEA